MPLLIGLLGGLVGCASGTPDDPPSIKHLLTGPPTATVTPGEPATAHRWIIEEAEDMSTSPSGTLFVRVSIPKLFNQKVYPISLTRKRVTADYAPRFPSVRGEAADGWTNGGKGIGYFGSVNVVATSENEITVEASFAGRGSDLKHVELSRRFTVAWGGRFEGSFDGTGRISANIDVNSAIAAEGPDQPMPIVDAVLMHRSACYGMCPVYEVEICRDGNVRFKGEENVAAKGTRTDRVTSQDMDEVARAVDRADFFNLREQYRYVSDGCKVWESDNPTVDIVVTRAGAKKHVEYYYGCGGLEAAKGIDALAKAIDRAAKTARWIGHE